MELSIVNLPTKNSNYSILEYLKSQPNYISCPGCGFVFENIGPGTELYSELSEEENNHFNTHRFRCRNCSQTFCAQCKIFPYHSGTICGNVNSSRTRCRFCDKKIGVFNENCTDCEILAQQCNKHKHTYCDHSCHYYSRYYSPNDCECLHQTCNKKMNLDDPCSICNEKLRRYPLLKLCCNHIFHAKCIERKVASRWVTNNISLAFGRCPLCYKQISTYFGCIPNLNYAQALRADLKLRIPTLMENHGIKMKAIISDDEYEDEALRKVNFYECFQCKSIYFGGLNECGQAEIPAERLLCNSCKGSCSKHGIEYLIYKCKFCCNIASHFCFGHTHFCSNCHPKAWDIINPNFYNCIKATIKTCPRDGSCPLGDIPHPECGEEFVVGCSACSM